MTEIKWDASELQALSSTFDGAMPRVMKRVREAVAEGGEKVAQRAKTLAPKRTGKLASSITSTVVESGGGADISAEIGPSTFYGKYQEHGTSKMRPHPFMGPALDSLSDEVAERIADAATDEVLK